MTENSTDSAAGFTDLVERITVLHNIAEWSERTRDIEAVAGLPRFTDEKSWAAFDQLSVGDETRLPAWCLLARAPDLGRVIVRAAELGWAAGAPVLGAHETRVVLTAPSGLVVVAYSPLRR
ncbi:hypothetical protein [Nocardia callitridis]|uniref:Glyoxalase-like domain-containing protein n=1 Tax=Nocardia callitridis TaxID=648753 RepID=A0ABP9KKI1_9NOCA